MGDIDTFIDNARAKGWDDGKIKETLAASGWTQPQIDAGMSGLVVPAPPTVAPSNAVAQGKPGQEHTQGRPSISALQAALQHVLLWLFTGTTTVMMSVVAFALFARGEGSSEALLTYVVLEIVTFTPFAFLYWRYLQQQRNQPDLMTGKVWSIITIVLHSVGLVGAAIGLILVIVLVHDTYTTAGVISSLLVGAMDGMVVVAYVAANFAKNTGSRLRKRYLQLFPVGLFILIATLGIAALIKVGPLRADDQTMHNLSTAVDNIHTYAQTHRELPDSLSQLSSAPAGVTYTKTASDSFKVCASFKAGHGTNDPGYTASNDDSYVDSSWFNEGSSGYRCWNFTDSDVSTYTPQIYNDYSSPDVTHNLKSSSSSSDSSSV